MGDLQAGVGRCQEASTISHNKYIPCNAPAERMVYSVQDRTEYRMCLSCATHNVRNRGMKDVGPYAGPAPQPVLHKEFVAYDSGVNEEGTRTVVPHAAVESITLTAEDLAAYAADARAAEASSATDLLTQITNTVTELMDVRSLVEERERLLKEATDRRDVLENITLPDLMQQAKQEKLRTSTGYDVELTETLRASIPKARLPEAIRWLVEHKQGGIVKREISLLFGRDQVEDAERLLKLIRPEGFAPDDIQTVHPQTLAAVVRELLAGGVEVPLDLLGVFRQKKVKIKDPKK